MGGRNVSSDTIGYSLSSRSILGLSFEVFLALGNSVLVVVGTGC